MCEHLREKLNLKSSREDAFKDINLYYLWYYIKDLQGSKAVWYASYCMLRIV